MNSFNVYYRSPITGRLCRFSAQPMTREQALKVKPEISDRLKVKATVGAH